MRASIRAKNAAHSMIWIGIYTVVTTISPFVVRTILIRRWGIEYAGLSSLFSSIMNVLTLGELGIGEALVYNMYRPAAEHNVAKLNALLLLYKKIYAVIGLITLLIGIACIPFLPILIKDSYPEAINLTKLYFVYLFNVVANYFFGAYYISIFRTHQSLYVTYKWRTIIFGLMYVVQVSVLWVTRNYYLYIIWVPVCTLCINFMDYLMVRRYYPEYHPQGSVEKSFWQQLFKRVGGMAIRKLRNVIRTSCDSLVVSAFLGVVCLAKYQNYILVITVPILFYGIFNSGILQSLGNSNAIETTESNYAVYRLYTFITQWVGTWFGAVLVASLNIFMQIWAGSDSVLSTNAEILFAIYFYAILMTYIPEMIRNSAGIWWEGKWVPFVESGINLVLNLILVRALGVEGVLLATILTIVFINIPFETRIIYKSYFQKSAKMDLLDSLYNGIITIVVIFSTNKICGLYGGNIVHMLISRLVISTLIANGLFIICHIRDSRLNDVVIIGKDLIRSFVGKERL